MTEVPINPGNEQRLLSILVVDDDAINLHLMRIHLLRLGQKVDTVRDGAAAVEKFRNNFYHAILMDIMMPVMDGVTATIEIRKIEDERATGSSERVTIVAITANSGADDRAGLFSAGVDYYMSKPFQVEELQRILNI